MSQVSLDPALRASASSAAYGRVPALRGWMLLLLALIAAAVFANSLRNGFTYDDLAIVRDNPRVTSLEWTAIWHENYWATKDGIQPDILYRPLTLWTYLANEALTPGQPWAFHLVNVLLHALVTVLVAMLAWRLLGDRTVALVSGLLFAVHPLHTEVVANTVGRAELLAAAWSLLAMLVYLPAAGLAGEGGPTRRPLWHGWLVSVCFLAAILSKETPATLPGALLLLDLWRWTRWRRATRPVLWKWFAAQAWRYYLPLGVAFFVYLAMRVNGPGLMTDTTAVHPVVNLLVKATLAERLVTPVMLLGKYVLLTFWPVRLSADYSAPSIVPTANPLHPGVLLGLLICVLTGILCLRTWRRSPQVVLLVGLFLFSYLLVSNVLRIGTIFAERLFYWPSVFVLTLVAWGAVRVVRRMAWASPSSGTVMRAVGFCALAAVTLAMSWRTIVRNRDWSDNITLAIATGHDNFNSAKACHWAGSVLIIAQDPAYRQVGLELLERSVELHPEMAGGYWEMAKHNGRNGDLGNALIHLAHAFRLDPGTHDTHVAATGILADLRAAAPETYMPTIRQYAQVHPDKAEAHLALAFALHAQKQWEPAEAAATRALTLGHRPSGGPGSEYHEAAAQRARIVFDSGRYELGLFMYYEYVERIHRSVDARCEYATMLLAVDPAQFPEALDKVEERMRQAEAIDRGNPRIREIRSRLSAARLAGSRVPERQVVSPLGPEFQGAGATPAHDLSGGHP